MDHAPAPKGRNSSMSFARRLLISAGAIASIAGCASRPINEPIKHIDPASGYRVSLKVPKRPDNDHQTLFLLAFSGGGTRAAALSYGVLEELRRTEIVVDGHKRRLLDEVDLITGVSGGSFTALSYALYGDQLFSEYETGFLKRNVQGALVGRAVNPFNWPKLVGGSYGRSELAADYYDEILFHGATFADLLDKPTPVAVATATDLSTGARLAFGQSDFDLLCSDLSKVRLARAAATSSAVPVVLSPVTFSNYGGTCGYEYPAWVKDVADPNNRSRPAGRSLLRYRDMQEFQKSKERPYIHLVDGGVSDNLGMRAILEGLEEIEASPAFRAVLGMERVRRIVVIVVNSRSSPSTDWDKGEPAPGVFSQLLQSSSVPIDRYSYESVELLKDMVHGWTVKRELMIARARLAGQAEAQASASVPDIDVFAIDVSFDAIADPKERAYFMNQPTSFVLTPEAVDRLRAVAGVLLRQSADYQRLLKDLGAAPRE
jgi:NTE family protein